MANFAPIFYHPQPQPYFELILELDGFHCFYPSNIQENDVYKFIESKKNWISARNKQWLEWQNFMESITDYTTTEFEVAGKKTVIMSHNYIPKKEDLIFENQKYGAIYNTEQGLSIQTKKNLSNPQLASSVKSLLSLYSLKYLEQCLLKTYQKHNLNRTPLKIEKMARAWGKCYSTGRIVLHPNLVFFSQRAVEYVILHEHAHLFHLDHSSSFWSKLSEWIPQSRVEDQWFTKEEIRLSKTLSIFGRR